jgi:hypothetical protein
MRRTPSPRRLVATVVALAVTGVVLSGSGAALARGEDLSSAQAASLAGRASDDPGALAELRAAGSVDGVPIDLDPVLEGTVAARDARLAQLATLWGESSPGESPTAAVTPTADDARADAQRVLDEDRFHDRSVPKPFRSVLRWIGDRLADLWAPIANALAPIFGEGLVPWVVLGGFGLLVALFARRMVANRSRAAVLRAATGSSLVDLRADPVALDRSADEAADVGDFATAIRLRHEAGLLRLVRDGRLDLRPETTARQAAAQVEDPAMDRLTSTFEAVVYGDRPASAADHDAVVADWHALLGARVRR